MRAGSGDGGVTGAAQLVSSTISGNSICARRGNVGLGILHLLVDGDLAPGFFRALGPVCKQALLGLLCPVVGEILASTSAAGAPREGMRDGQHGGQGDKLPVRERPGHSSPRARRAAAWFAGHFSGCGLPGRQVRSA